MEKGKDVWSGGRAQASWPTADFHVTVGSRPPRISHTTFESELEIFKKIIILVYKRDGRFYIIADARLGWILYLASLLHCKDYFVEELWYVTCGWKSGNWGNIYILTMTCIFHTHAHTYIRFLFITKWQEILSSLFSMCDLVRYQRPIKGDYMSFWGISV